MIGMSIEGLLSRIYKALLSCNKKRQPNLRNWLKMETEFTKEETVITNT